MLNLRLHVNEKFDINIAWFLIILGGIIECFWVSGLKYSTEIWQYILTAIGVCISFTCLYTILSYTYNNYSY